MEIELLDVLFGHIGKREMRIRLNRVFHYYSVQNSKLENVEQYKVVVNPTLLELNQILLQIRLSQAKETYFIISENNAISHFPEF